jgi:hypothetical protein
MFVSIAEVNYIDEVFFIDSACRLAPCPKAELSSCSYGCDGIKVLRSLSFL